MQESRLLTHFPNNASIYAMATSTTSGLMRWPCKSDTGMVMLGRTRLAPQLPIRASAAVGWQGVSVAPRTYGTPLSWLLINHRIHHIPTLPSTCLIPPYTSLASPRRNGVTRPSSALDRGYVCFFTDRTVSRNQSALLLGAEPPTVLRLGRFSGRFLLAVRTP